MSKVISWVRGFCGKNQRRKVKKRLRQQGNPCLHDLRKKFTPGASTRQTSIIKLRRRSWVGGWRVLKRAIRSFLDIFNLLLAFMIFVAYRIEWVFKSRVSFPNLGKAYWGGVRTEFSMTFTDGPHHSNQDGV